MIWIICYSKFRFCVIIYRSVCKFKGKKKLKNKMIIFRGRADERIQELYI